MFELFREERAVFTFDDYATVMGAVCEGSEMLLVRPIFIKETYYSQSMVRLSEITVAGPVSAPTRAEDQAATSLVWN
jgi:hypothetical protein